MSQSPSPTPFNQTPEHDKIIAVCEQLLGDAGLHEAIPSYDDFEALFPPGKVFLDLVEAQSNFKESLWNIKIRSGNYLGTLTYEAGMWLYEESRKREDNRFQAVFFNYIEYPQFIIQYSPASPAHVNLWHKELDGSAVFLKTVDSLAEARLFVAFNQQGVISEKTFELFEQDPARPWTYQGRGEAVKHAGIPISHHRVL